VAEALTQVGVQVHATEAPFGRTDRSAVAGNRSPRRPP
jgi:hypothetical protein